jgi:AcrR family transcriptional regulator
MVAMEGPEGLSVSQVAQAAGVNRGTAYQHFQSREQLVKETMAWVSERLREAAFGSAADQAWSSHDPQLVSDHLLDFLMENPELGRVWLFDILSSSRPDNDPFWTQYRGLFEKFSESELAQPGIDSEVHGVLMLMGTFLWPVWARAHSRNAKERTQMARRFTTEVLRLSLHGTMRPEKFPDLEEKLLQGRKAKSPK